jgi:hypothetical protein
MLRGEKTILVLTDVTITPPDGSKHDATLRYVFHLDGGETDAPEVEIPGVPNGRMQVLAVSPNDGAVVLKLRGVSRDPSAEHRAATTESLSVDVTRKPLIALVWGGFYVLMTGALIALVKRSREARRAAVEKTLALPRPEPADSVGAPPRAPLPLHTRSRL